MKKPVTFVCYPKCSTCQKARKWLDDRGIAYEPRDIKAQNPSAGEIEAWRSLSGLPLKKFFNTSGNSYKNLNLKDRLPRMSEPEQTELLASDGMLVKRPILAGPDFALVGFDPDEWEKKALP
ncbi:MAG: arsenate reductase family protein [Synergistaceae bacterium]|jgi:arsenate reductase|nr:arsenate reductase family protein [Synergistaceae bacterium]